MNLKILVIFLALFLVGGTLWWFLSDTENNQIISSLPSRELTEGVTVVAFGDSLTAGFGLPLNESYPSQLQDALEENGIFARVINAGVSGETTRGNKERAEFIRSQNPDVVLLGIGGNDALRQLSIEEAQKNITDTVRVLQSGKNPPVVILLKMQAPLNAGLAYKRRFDDMYKNIADAEQIILVPFLTTEVFFDNANKLPDGIHLNQKGYKTVVDKYILPTLIPVVRQLEG